MSGLAGGGFRFRRYIAMGVVATAAIAGTTLVTAVPSSASTRPTVLGLSPPYGGAGTPVVINATNVLTPVGGCALNGTTTVTGAFGGISVGWQVAGANIPSGTTVSAVTPTTLTLSNAATATATETLVFSGVSAINFGSSPSSFVLNADGTLTAIAPGGSGVVDVLITAPGGTSTPTAKDKFNYAPTVTGLSPGAGSAGSAVVISGTNVSTSVPSSTLNATTAVTTTASFAGVQVGWAVAGANIPPGTTVSAIGSSTSLTLSAAATAAATEVLVFSGVTAVHFGTSSASSFTLNADGTLTAIAPGGSGVVDVLVTGPGGTSAVNPQDKFNYGPAVTGLNPNYGSVGTAVIISGSNISTAVANSTLNATTAVTTTGSFGAVQVGWAVAGANVPPGTTVSAIGSSTSLTLSAAATASGSETLFFSGVTAVHFGTGAASSFALNADGTMTATAPAGTGIVNVLVTSPGGTSGGNAASRFNYGAVVYTLSPNIGPASGGTIVLITGGNFLTTTAVHFGKQAAPFVINSNTSITATAPASKNPSAMVTVTASGGTSAPSSVATFNYGPVVAHVQPSYGVGSGGTKVSISGSGLRGAKQVMFGTTPALSFKVKSPTKILAFAPSGTGLVNISVTTAAGTSAIITPDQYDYAPTITAISPNHGKPKGGTAVSIVGTNLTGVSSVTFGATSVTFTVVSPKKITVVSPPGVGTVPVTVTTLGGSNPAGPTATFTY